jgi:hypothetical protein
MQQENNALYINTDELVSSKSDIEILIGPTPHNPSIIDECDILMSDEEEIEHNLALTRNHHRMMKMFFS